MKYLSKIICAILSIIVFSAKASDFTFYNATNTTFTLEVQDVYDGFYNKTVTINPGLNNIGDFDFSGGRSYTLKIPYNSSLHNDLIHFYKQCNLVPLEEWYIYNGKMILEDTGLHGVCKYTIVLGISPEQAPDIPIPQPLNFSPSDNMNYISTTIFNTPQKNLEVALLSTNAVRTVQYFEGFARPLQLIEWQSSPSKKDVISYFEYDNYGRESVKYLPFTTNSIFGKYISEAKDSLLNFYVRTDITNVVRTNKPYAQTIYEKSTLNRILQQGAPGNTWQPSTSRTSTGRTIVTDYGSNVAAVTEAVKLWKINTNNIGATGTTNYAGGKLYKTVIKDENWVSGKAGTVEEYKDFEGRVILKRVWESDMKKLDTYYVYDFLGNLRFIVPPGFTSSTITENDVAFNELIYAYKYDAKRRLIEKKLPGKGWEWIVYNENDQAVLTQDSVQRASKKWSYTKYDAFGRVTETGIYTNTLINNRMDAVDSLENHKINNVKYFWEERNSTNYSNRTFPTSSGKKAYVINYYDDYSFKSNTLLSAKGEIDSTYLVKTLLTGTRVWSDDSTLPLLTVNYYDKRGRLVQSARDNHLGGTEYVTNTYTFLGELSTSKREHKGSASGTVTTLLTTYVYDHVGRLKDTKHKVNSQAEVILARNEYNEIGQLNIKKQHSENNGTSFINTVTYNYNERGWTTKASSPHFTYQLNYNTGTSLQYNGNISQQLWGHNSTSTPNIYSYTYDKLNRLLNGTSVGTVMSEVLTYDDLGNIKTLKRDNGTTTTYNYMVNAVPSNRLQSLTGGISGSYTYDANGNATEDRTGMTFAYNHLNLLKSANKSGTTVNYLYSATGTKLRKTTVVGSTTIVRDYIGGIEYSKIGAGSQVIEMIHTPEGYLQPNGTNYIYYYNQTDHLGNVRAVLYKNPTTGAIESVQQTDYYPFGKQKTLKAGINKYLYNGKEVQSELGDQQDYGARVYDAEIGRWNVVDPLADNDGAFSPYVYAFNRPLVFIDPDGQWPNWGKLWNNVSSWFRGAETYFGGHIQEVVVYGKKLQSDIASTNWNQIGNDVLRSTPVLGSSLISGDYLENGHYAMAGMWFGYSALELFSFGYASGYTQAQRALSSNIVSKSIPVVDDVAAKTGGNVVYHSVEAGVTQYVGITNNLARREAQHLGAKGIKIEPLMQGLTRSDARAVEQALIEIHGLGKNGGTLLNKINSISLTNPIYGSQLQRGYELLKSIGYH